MRRVPLDLADSVPFSRIQRSLRTPDRATAFQAAAHVHLEVEKQFAALRRKTGVTLDVVPTDDRTWLDGQRLAEWIKATLVDDDWCARLKDVPGAAFNDASTQRCFGATTPWWPTPLPCASASAR